MSTDQSIVSKWLKSLGVLVATGMSVTDAKERLSVFVPLLSREFDARFFNAATLTFVARKCKFFPTFSEICEHLSDCGSTEPQSVPMLEGPTEDGWKVDVAAQRAEAVRDWSDPLKVQSSMRLVLSDECKQLELGRMLAALVNRHAPQNLGLLPPAWLENIPQFAAP